jgi:hypothetical protein
MVLGTRAVALALLVGGLVAGPAAEGKDAGGAGQANAQVYEPAGGTAEVESYRAGSG